MFDENLKIYGAMLAGCAVIAVGAYVADPLGMEVVRISAGGEERLASVSGVAGVGATGAIETATVSVDAPPPGARAWNHPAIPWRRFRDGLQEMRETGKSGVLVLQADWCLECRNYQRLFTRPEVAEKRDDVVFILADIDAEPDLQERFDIDGDYVPRTIVLAPDGVVAQDRTGGHPERDYFVDPYEPDELIALLEAASGS